MKTDSIFYRLFQELLSIFFELIGNLPETANIYQFASVEIKQTAFRIDGVFLPTQLTAETLEIFSPNGQKFLTPVEIDQLREQERQRAEQERQAKEAALQELQQERDRYQELLAKLKAQGIDTDNL